MGRNGHGASLSPGSELASCRARLESATVEAQMGHIFVSYSHADGAVAREIERRLRESGAVTWIDVRRVELGESFVTGINQGLYQASYLLFIVSKSSIASKWVTMEVEAALASEATVVIPVLIDDVSLDTWPLLKTKLRVDFRVGPEAAIERLIAFLVKEKQPATPKPRMMAANKNPLRGASRRELRLVASQCMNETLLSAFLWDADLDTSQLEGASLHARLVSLLHLVDRDGVIEHFADWLQKERGACVSTQLNRIKTTES